MSIYMKALEYQNKTATLYADPISAPNMEAYKASKKTLEAAFKAIASLPNYADMVLLTTNLQKPDEITTRKYNQWLYQVRDPADASPSQIADRINQIKKDKAIRVSLDSLNLATRVLVAEAQYTANRQTMFNSPAFLDYRTARKDFKASIKSSFESGLTKDQVIADIKDEAYQANDRSLNYRVLDKVDSWAQKYSR